MSNASDRRVVIVGGGLAGLAAAVRCTRLGLQPIVLEKRAYLGGRAFSFVDRETGVEVDNGQHVFVGACTEYRAFLKEIGAWDKVHVQRRLEVPVLRNGSVSRLRWSNLPLAGMAPSLLRYGHLSFLGKLRVVYGMIRLRMVNPEREAASLEAQTFRHWLERHGQDRSTIDNLWNLLVLPALNDDISDVSAAAGVMLFQTTLLGEPGAAAIGYPKVGLSALAGQESEKHLTELGGEIHCQAEVTGLTL